MQSKELPIMSENFMLFEKFPIGSQCSCKLKISYLDLEVHVN